MARPIIAIIYECARWPNESRVYPILPCSALIYRKAGVVSNNSFQNEHGFSFLYLDFNDLAGEAVGHERECSYRRLAGLADSWR